MPAFLLTPIARYIIIAFGIFVVIGLAVLYVKWTSDTIATLNRNVEALTIQAQSLQAAKDNMQKDIADVQKRQITAEQNLATIRVTTSQTANKIRQSINNTSDPKALEIQVNHDTNAAFRSLETLSR